MMRNLSSESGSSEEEERYFEDACPYVLIGKQMESTFPTYEECSRMSVVLKKFLGNIPEEQQIYISDNGTHWCAEICYSAFDHARYYQPFLVYNVDNEEPPVNCDCIYCIRHEYLSNK